MKTYKNGTAALHSIQTSSEKFKAWASRAADQGFEKAAKFMAKHPKATAIMQGVGGLTAVYGGGKLFGAACKVWEASTAMVNAQHPVAMQSSFDKAMVFLESAGGYVVGGIGLVAGGATMAVGAYGIHKAYKYAKDNRLALKARVGLRKLAQKNPKVHSFLVAANHKISKGIAAVKREMAGGR